jgi:hypothetical protein
MDGTGIALVLFTLLGLFGWCNAYGATVGAVGGVKPYNLVVVGVFKNESWVLGEWIQHYIDEGVDHFYLVDNGSPDNYHPVLLGFSDTLVTVVRDGSPHQLALQVNLSTTSWSSPDGPKK